MPYTALTMHMTNDIKERDSVTLYSESIMSIRVTGTLLFLTPEKYGLCSGYLNIVAFGPHKALSSFVCMDPVHWRHAHVCV